MYVMRLISPRRKERKGKETRCVVPATEIKNKRKTGEEREGEKRNASKKRCIKKLSKSAARAAAPQLLPSFPPLPTRPHPHQWNCFQCCRAASAPEESPSGCLLAVSLQSRPGNKISATWPSNMQQQTGGRQHVQQDDDLLA